MSADIHKFLESGLLELYLIGETDAAETEQVEHYLTTSAEVRKEYASLQATVEQAMNETAHSPPMGTRGDINKKIETAKNINGDHSTIRKMRRWVIAASVTAAVVSLIAIYFFGRTNELKLEKAAVIAEATQVKTDLQNQQADCQNLVEKLRLLSHPDTRTFRLNGNENAPQFEVIAFWNEAEKSGLVNLAALPKLPEKQCFQMWADVDGEMLSVGILGKDDDDLQALTYLPEATSLNVTIEPEGGSDHPNVSRLVANVAI